MPIRICLASILRTLLFIELCRIYIHPSYIPIKSWEHLEVEKTELKFLLNTKIFIMNIDYYSLESLLYSHVDKKKR